MMDNVVNIFLYDVIIKEVGGSAVILHLENVAHLRIWCDESIFMLVLKEWSALDMDVIIKCQLLYNGSYIGMMFEKL